MGDATTGANLAASRPWWDTPAGERLIVVFALWLAVALIYWPSAVALDAIWRGAAGNAYTHGYLVLISSLWLIVRDRKYLETTPIRPVGWAWVLTVLLSVGWVFAWRAAIQTLHLLLLPAILLTALMATLGWRITRRCVLPVCLLLFAMPIWDPISASLQTASAKLTALAVWLSGMPIYLQGDLIRLPGGTIEIAQACAGLNGVVIGLTVATLYGALARDPLRRRLAWLALMTTLAVIANGLRIFVVVVAAYETDMRSRLVTHHIWLGWCLFAGAVGLFLLIAGRFADRWDRRLGVQLPDARPPPALPTESPRPHVARLAIAVACMAVLPALSYGMDLVHSSAPDKVVIQWPEVPRSWRGPMKDTVSGWSPRFVGSSAESQRMYSDPGAQTVEVFAVAYRMQTQEGKLLGYWNDLLGSPARLQAREQGIADSPAGRWRETVAVDPAGNRSLIWWRYRIGHRVFIDPRLSQLWYGLEALTGSPPVSSLTALRVSCGTDCAAARAQLAAVAARLQPALVAGAGKRQTR
jgi:exosortase